MRVGVISGHLGLHGGAQLVLRETFPVRRARRSRRRCAPTPVALHQPGAPGDRRHQPGTQRALPVQRRNLGRCSRSASAMRICPEARRDPIAIAAATSAAANPTGQTPTTRVRHRARRGGGSTPRSRPTAAHRRSLLAHPVLDRRHKLHIAGGREHRIEHTFEYTPVY